MMLMQPCRVQKTKSKMPTMNFSPRHVYDHACFMMPSIYDLIFLRCTQTKTPAGFLHVSASICGCALSQRVLYCIFRTMRRRNLAGELHSISIAEIADKLLIAVQNLKSAMPKNVRKRRYADILFNIS